MWILCQRKFQQRIRSFSGKEKTAWHQESRSANVENKFYIKKLDSYEKASEISKIRMGTEPSYDLDLLPSVQMQKEMRKFLKYRGQQLGAEKFYTERRFYHHLCKMLQTRRDRPESFLDWDKEKWKQQMKIWLLQQGLPLTEISKSHCGNETVSQAKTLHYIDRLIDYFLDLRDADVDEMTKDVWQLEKLDIQVKQDLTRTTRIINFKEISQQDLREEVKKAIYFQLKTESIGTVKKEMTAIRRFSRYLKENNKEVDSCSKLDRKIMEEYLIYMKTEDTGTKRYRAELTRLRALLNMVADVYQYPQVKDLILNRDIPPDIRGEIKIYSDQELKRFNAFLTKVDVQTARLMLIHQMLGTRMSDAFKYELNKEDEPHMIKNKISHVSIELLETEFKEVMKKFDDLIYFLDNCIFEYSLGTFTKSLSRADIWDISKRLPVYEEWRTEKFKEVKDEIKQEYHLGSKEFSDAVNLIKENREFSVNIGCEKVFGSITENELKEYASLVRYYSEKSKSDNKGKEIGFDLRKIQKNGEILKKYLSSISMNTLNTLLCFSEMSNSFLAVEHLEEVHDDIVSKAFDGTYLIRKLKQRNICLRILYGMKKCGQVTYAKQLSAALEQEGVELTL